jgi:hypothetical protein
MKASSSSSPSTASLDAKTTTKENTSVLTSAPPPLHSVFAIGILSAVFVNYLPSVESLDEAAKVETFTRVIFPDYMNVYSLAYLRLLIAATIWWTSFQTAVLSNGWTQKTTYQPGSKLKMVPNRLKGIKTMFPFTSWCWNMLGLSFTLNAYIAIHGAAAKPVDPWLLRVALCVWEISAPCAILVSLVIRYAIWPAVLASPTGDTTNLKRLRNVMMHNVNSVYAISELAITGGLPVRFNELSLLPLYGVAYVIFSWCMTMSWNEAAAGPQFIYFFFDTTLPGYKPTLALLALLSALLVIFGILCVCEQILAWIDGGFLAHLAFCAVICGGVMRFRD